MSQIFPTLSVLPVDRLLLHEKHDDQRALLLKKRLCSEGILRNPLLVTALSDDTGHYVVLDGANRTVAFQALGSPHVLAQVVARDDPCLALKSWNHVICRLPADALLACIQSFPNLELHLSEGGRAKESAKENSIAQIHLTNGEIYSASSPVVNLTYRVDLLNAIVDCYANHTEIHRTKLQAVEPLTRIYPEMFCLVVFPQFQIGEILHLARAGQQIPAGVTRFIVSPRALRVNYPLDELEANKPLAEKNASLQEWMQGRLISKGVRYYEEAVVLFDE